jgi:uncharacterized protein
MRLHDDLVHICRLNDVSMIGVFGSTARGEAKKQSDMDLIVRFSKRKSVLAVVRLERELSAALGRKVDLLTEGAISPYLRERILKEMRLSRSCCDTTAYLVARRNATLMSLYFWRRAMAIPREPEMRVVYGQR